MHSFVLRKIEVALNKIDENIEKQTDLKDRFLQKSRNDSNGGNKNLSKKTSKSISKLQISVNRIPKAFRTKIVNKYIFVIHK